MVGKITFKSNQVAAMRRLAAVIFSRARPDSRGGGRVLVLPSTRPPRRATGGRRT